MNKLISEIYPELKYPNTLAKIDNQYAFLEEKVPEDGKIEILDISNTEGRRTYERTLVFLLDYISKKNGITIKIEHSYGDTLYGRILKGKLDIKYAKKEIKKLVKSDKKIRRTMLTKLEAIHLLKDREDDLNILKHLSKSHIPVYTINNFSAYFAGPLLPRTGMLSIYDLVPIKDGFLVILPSSKDPSKLGKIEERKKLFKAYKTSKEEAEILKIWDVARLNECIVSGGISSIIKMSESIHSERITEISNQIINMKGRVKIILISGPSSSGKTTMAKRIGIHLCLHDLEPEYISLDDYFLNREDTPIYKNGTHFFDSIESIDVDLFRKHIKELLNGKEIQTFSFNFKTGKRERQGRKIRINPKTILIVEGLHSFNPELLNGINTSSYKIYVSALTQLNINRVNRIPTRDLRLLRRVFRDTRYRGHTAEETLRKWESVKVGEEKFIFPYQETSDIMFNSSLVYELAVLKRFLETPLRCVEINSPFYCEALRLLNFLDHFLEIGDYEIPPTSILREFIGGSSFYY